MATKIAANGPGLGQVSTSRDAVARLVRRGHVDRAWAVLTRRLAQAPGEAETLRMLESLADREGWYAAALPWLDAAIAASPPERAQLWRYRGAYVAQRAGQTDLASTYLRAILAQDASAATAYTELAHIHHKQGDTATALAWLDAGEQALPEEASLPYYRGRILSNCQDLTGEADCYRRAIARKPDHAHAHYALIRTLEKQNDLAGARQAQADAAAILGTTPQLTATAARLALRQGDAESARRHLEGLAWDALDAESRQDTLFLAGQVHDRLGETERAIACFTEGNAHLAATDRAQRADAATFHRRLDRLHAWLQPDQLADWPAPQPGPADARTPIFLVGFPRSGTTLLEVALASHTGAVVLEEKPVVGQLVAALNEQPSGFPDAIFGLGPQQVAELRQRYVDVRASYLAAGESRLVVDKLPLNIQHAALLYRLFPEAKFIFALRHPADAVLSCFMQDFTPNMAMNNFYSLADATHTYDRVMGLWQRYLALLPLPVATVPYEALIADFNAIIAGALDFLGLPWDPAVARYHERATADAIHTPSYAQVAQPLYDRARYRWQRYQDAFGDHLATLRSWAAWFGYSEAADGTVTAPGFQVR